MDRNDPSTMHLPVTLSWWALGGLKLSLHLRHRRVPLLLLALPSSIPVLSVDEAETSNGLAPIGTAPGFVVKPLNRLIKAMAAAGTYRQENMKRARFENGTRLRDTTVRAKM